MLQKINNIDPPIHLLLKNKKVLKSLVNEASIAQFIKDLSILINSSVPLVKSLKVLANQQKNKELKNIINNLADSIHGGMPLSTSLMKYSKTFDSLFINMVKAGEMSSNLGEVLERIAKYKEKELKFKQKIKSILIYPLIVITISIVIISLLFLFIIPKFESVFTNIINPDSLPFPTKIIISISHSLSESCIILGGILGVFLLLVIFFKKNNKDRILLKIPFIGNLIKDINISLFSRILGTLITNGVPLIEAVKGSKNVINNSVIKNNISKIDQGIAEGETLSNLLASNGQFPEIAISLIHMGEETGTLSKMLLEIANKFDEEIELKLERFTSILEPLMTLFLAIIIGFIVIALFLPIINVMNNIITF